MGKVGRGFCVSGKETYEEAIANAVKQFRMIYGYAPSWVEVPDGTYPKGTFPKNLSVVKMPKGVPPRHFFLYPVIKRSPRFLPKKRTPWTKSKLA
jgi:hypothetical protein